jgi:hypothetical protein
MNYKKEINFLKNTMIQQDQIIMELQKMIMGHNAFLSERLCKIEEKLTEQEADDVEEATDETPGHIPGKLKTPLQEIGKPDVAPIDGISYA